MNTKKAFQKILVATMVASMAFASMVFASNNNTAKAQEEQIEITITSDIELVKRTRNEGAQFGSGNEFTETKISISDIKNGDAVFCEKDDNGKVTKIILLEKPERKEGDDQNKPQGRFGKGFDRATRSYASRADGFKPQKEQRNDNGQKRNGQNPPPRGNGAGLDRGMGQGNPPQDGAPQGNKFGSRVNRSGNFGVVESISGNKITLKQFSFMNGKDRQGTNNNSTN